MPFCPTHVRTTAAGAKVFAEQDRRQLRVVESALDVAGPCVWVLADPAAALANDGIMLNLEDAQLVVDGLLRFILDAQAQEREKAAKAS